MEAIDILWSKIIGFLVLGIIFMLVFYFIYTKIFTGGILDKLGEGAASVFGAIKDSYGRGVGKPVHACDQNSDKDGALCYPKCSSGYTGVGPVCWSQCPPNTVDIGAVCTKKTLTASKRPCSFWDSNYRDDGTSCWADTYGRGVGYPWKFGDGLGDYESGRRCAADNPQGCEKYGAIWYPKCKSGYHSVGSNLCEPDGGAGIKKTLFDRYTCPDGYTNVAGVCWPRCSGNTTDTGAQCQKKSYGRTAGTPLVCGPDEDLNGGLCYPKCRDGYYAAGPMCWKKI